MISILNSCILIIGLVISPANDMQTSPMKVSTPLHPQHVSIMQIDHMQTTKTLEITLKSFVDDMEIGVSGFKKDKIFLEQVQVDSEQFIWVGDYVLSTITIKTNGVLNTLNCVGWELDGDEVFMYFETAVPKNLKELEIENNLLMEIYSDQTNIVHLKSKGNNKSIFLQKNSNIKKFALED